MGRRLHVGRRPLALALRGARAGFVLASIFAILAISCAREAGITGSGTVEMDEVDVASMVGGRLAAFALLFFTFSTLRFNKQLD